MKERVKFLDRVASWFRGGNIKDMPPVVKTIEAVIRDLNAEGKGTWVILDEYYGLNSVEVESATINFLAAKSGLVLKAFLNVNTTEVRIYLAKQLDTPDRAKLYGY